VTLGICSVLINLLPTLWIRVNRLFTRFHAVKATLLDIETTSLYADTGMLVCGVLRRDGKDKVLFVESPRREPKVLSRLLGELRKCDHLVTFNGRSFDLPFILSRALVIGIENPTLDLPRHVDLYDECKRVLRFDRHGLDHIARLLGIEVNASLTGQEVPHLYMTYLATKDPEVREQIIGHCVSDIDTMEGVSKSLAPLLPKEEET
jgi:uncharacterized protein YprB with RNaseH-like and TPR domain